MKEILKHEAPVPLSEGQIETFCRFGEALIEQNKVMNLTAITEPDAVARLHFVDCMALLPLADLRNRTVIDVGCGAGFPGVPRKFMDSYVVFIEDDGTGNYHRYDCGKFSKKNFWAYSRKLAERQGYTPCAQCFGS